MRNHESFNPSKTPGINLTAGKHVPTKEKASGGAGKQMGPAIGKGYLVTGTGTTKPTGGKFASANKAKDVTKRK